MATIYDHRPRTAGAGPGMPGWIGAGLGAAEAREQTQISEKHEAILAEARAKEEAYQHESQLMQLRLEEAKRLSGQKQAQEAAAREGLTADIMDPQGRWHEMVKERLGPEQKAALERWSADPNLPAGFIEAKLDEWGDQFQLKDLLDQVDELERRAELISGGAGGEGANPLSDTIEELIETAKADPTDENIRKATLELREIERRQLIDARAHKRWERAQVEQDEILADPEAKLPDAEEPNYDEFIDLLTDIDSAVKTIRHPATKEIVPKDYDSLIQQLRYYAYPKLQEGAAQVINRKREQQDEMMRENPEVYRQLSHQYGGAVPMGAYVAAVRDREFQAGMMEDLQAQRGQYDPSQMTGDPGFSPGDSDYERYQQSRAQEARGGQGYYQGRTGSPVDPLAPPEEQARQKLRGELEALKKMAPHVRRRKAGAVLKWARENTEGMTDAEFIEAVEKKAAEEGLPANFDVIESLLAEPEPPKGKPGPHGVMGGRRLIHPGKL